MRREPKRGHEDTSDRLFQLDFTRGGLRPDTLREGVYVLSEQRSTVTRRRAFRSLRLRGWCDQNGVGNRMICCGLMDLST